MTDRAPSWNGWSDGPRVPLPPPARRELRRLLGRTASTPSVPIGDVTLLAAGLPAAVADRLTAAVGRAQVRTGRTERIRHAAGRGYLDLIRLRSGDASRAPDAVVHPGTADEIRAVLDVCAETGVAVVPFGGGTGVVGGVNAVRDGFDAVIALDLDRFDRLVDLDPVSRTATLQAGMRGPEVEAALAERGFMLGHFPQSHRFATLGGWVATRSAGQASTGYGRIDELVHALRCVTPTGELRLGRGPASAAGPRLLDMVVGSEGTLGVITQATMSVRPTPARRRYEGWSLPDLPSALRAFRALAQRLGPGLAPDVCRLSDPDETRTTLLLSSGPGTRVARGYLSLRGRRPGCMAILGWEGEPDLVSYRHRAAARLLRAYGGLSLGAAPGRSWVRGRFGLPELRDTLLDHGLLVETVETATDWSALSTLRESIRATLRAALGRTLVMTHLSHLYPAGASLYVTVLAARDTDDPIGQWTRAKRAVTATIVRSGATLTHHHAVGADHRDFLPDEIGAGGVAMLRAVKSAVDPAGIMNPGTLLPEG